VDTRRIDLEKFAKSYGKFVAIEGITLEVEVREF
jgi:ABC-type sugar transport system ATPase subunit